LSSLQEDPDEDADFECHIPGTSTPKKEPTLLKHPSDDGNQICAMNTARNIGGRRKSSALNDNSELLMMQNIIKVERVDNNPNQIEDEEGDPSPNKAPTINLLQLGN